MSFSVSFLLIFIGFLALYFVLYMQWNAHIFDREILYLNASKMTLGPTLPPIQWVPGDSFPGSKAAGV